MSNSHPILPSRRRLLAQAVSSVAVLLGLTAGARRALAQQPPVRASTPPATPSRRPAGGAASGAAALREMTVYKDPNCGCCALWAQHVREAGFTVTERGTADLPGVKASMGVPEALASCHTARIGRYVVEGHVPADLITQLLREQPDARGLAVPGMPIGSPGMEGGRPEKYDVLLFDRAGKTRVYATRG